MFDELKVQMLWSTVLILFFLIWTPCGGVWSEWWNYESNVIWSSCVALKQNFYIILYYYTNSVINYLNLTAKWYISKNFHNSKLLVWEEYIRYLKLALNGERQDN